MRRNRLASQPAALFQISKRLRSDSRPPLCMYLIDTRLPTDTTTFDETYWFVCLKMIAHLFLSLFVTAIVKSKAMR